MHGSMNHDSTDKRYIEKCLKLYGELNGELHLVILQRGGGRSGGTGGGGGESNDSSTLGLSLAGNRDLATMSVYVVGIQPGSVVANDGFIRVGDELLEINGQILYGRSHLNSSAIIKSITSKTIRILLLRSKDFLNHMAVGPLKFSPVEYKEDGHDSRLNASDESDADENDNIAEDNDNSVTSPKRFANHIAGTSPKIRATTGLSDMSATQILPADQQQQQSSAVEVQVHRSPCEVTVINRPPANKTGRLQKCAPVDDDLETVSDASAADQQSGRNLATKTNSNTSSTDHHRIKSDGDGGRSRLDDFSPGDSSSDSSTHPVLGGAFIEDPATCAIACGQNTTIEIKKGKIGLGVKVIGGSDTSIRAIVVYEIYKDGAAAKDGRLRPGDELLEVNGIDLREFPHHRAVQTLRQTTSSCMRLVIHRDERGEGVYRDDDLCDVISIELVKRPGKGLGISIVERGNNTGGVVVSDVVKGGAAEVDGRLLPGDQILSVNGEDVRQAPQEYTAQLLKTLMGKVTLSIARLKAGSRPAGLSARNGSSCPGGGGGGGVCGSDRGLTKSESNAGDCKSIGQRIVKSLSSSKSY